MNAHNTSSVVQDPEPLCLLAGDNNDVSVTNYLMQEHQVDGLRFLFKHFNEKSPGVIVNFPASSGKSATVAIFLNAVANMLKNPVLILCKDDGGMQYWKEILLQWSSYVEDEIAIEASNPFVKGTKVFLKKRENLYSYLRRRWSIIIIKENVANKDLLKLSFEADFKICITAADIKKDLPLLTAFFNWLYPQKVINFNDFVAKENHPREKFRKSVQLDFLLEDVAIRRYVNLKPFQTNEKAENVKEIETNVTEIAKNVTEVETQQTDQKLKVQRSKQVNDEGVNEISSQAFLLINDQLLNPTSDQDIILINDDDDTLNKISHTHTLDDSSYQNTILLDEQSINKTNHKVILVNDQALNESVNQNVIFVNDDQIRTQTLDQNVVFVHDDQISVKVSHNHTLDNSLNQNPILINEQFVNKTNQNLILFNDLVLNETSNQNVIFINDDQILTQTLDQNMILRNDRILNKISHKDTLNESVNKNLIFIDEPILSKTDQNIILISDHDVHQTSNPNNFLINDDHTLNQISDQNIIFLNHQTVNETSDKNLFLEKDNIVPESFSQNLISLDKKILNEASNQNILLMNDQQLDKTLINKKIYNKSSKNAIFINEKKLSKSSLQNVILPNDYNKVNPTLDENVIIIDDDDENEANINNFVNNVHYFSVDSENNKLNKINGYKSTIINKNKKIEISDDDESCKLDVDSFILERKPINRDEEPSRLYDKEESKITQFSESLGIESESKIDLSDMEDLDDKDLLKEQLMVSLHLDESINNLKKIKEESSLKKEPVETESLNFENNSKLDINKIKDLRNQLIESLGLDKVGKVSVNEIKNSENKNTSKKILPNKINDLRNKHLLQKQLFESLGLNSDCQEIQKLVKGNNIELNVSKNIEDTLIKEESIESLSFGIESKFYKKDMKSLDTNLIKEESIDSLSLDSKSKFDKKDMETLDTNLIKEESAESLSFGSKSKFKNNIGDLDTNLIKEETAVSLNFSNNSKVEVNEMKDLRNRKVLQEQLIESLGLNDVKQEIKDEIQEEATNETSGVVENMHNVVQQIANDLEDNEIIVIKVESENGNVTDRNVNIENNKRKSDVIEEDLDFKILDLEEKALKKFKGSLLDNLF